MQELIFLTCQNNQEENLPKDYVLNKINELNIMLC